MASTLEHLVGLQAQVPRVPHLALWDRLSDYDPAELDGLMTSRAVVRTQLMRTTIHTVTAADALALRPLLQPVLDRTFSGTAWGQRLRGRDVAAVVAEAAELLAERPMGRAQLQRELAERHPGLDAEAVAFGVSYWVPWVQPPPRGLWTASGAAVMTTVDAWLGPAVAPASLDDLVLRYLRRLRAGERARHPGVVRADPAARGGRPAGHAVAAVPDEDGGELVDVPDGPLPDPDTPAPVRFLAEYDNVVLSHADRSRVVAEGDHVLLPGGAGGWTGTVLVDGLLRATWAARRDGTAGPDGPPLDGPVAG